MLHGKLISTLRKIPGIYVVEDESRADAILDLSGLAGESTSQYGHTGHWVQGGVRLVGKEDGVVLWADNITSSRFARSASSSFADNVAKSLARAMAQGK